MPSKINGTALATMLGGTVFLWAGITGRSVLQTAQSIIQGKTPATLKQTTGIDPGNVSGDVPAGITSGAGRGSLTPQGAYDHAGLMKLWIQVGGSASTARNAACHAIQESSGNPKARSSNPDGGTNLGLWQLDTRGVGAGHSEAELLDPISNARITVRATNNGRNWAQWATPGC